MKGNKEGNERGMKGNKKGEMIVRKRQQFNAAYCYRFLTAYVFQLS